MPPTVRRQFPKARLFVGGVEVPQKYITSLAWTWHTTISPNTLNISLQGEWKSFLFYEEDLVDVYGRGALTDAPFHDVSLKERIKYIRKHVIQEKLYAGSSIFTKMDPVALFVTDGSSLEDFYWGFKGFVTKVTVATHHDTNTQTMGITAEGCSKLLAVARTAIDTSILKLDAIGEEKLQQYFPFRNRLQGMTVEQILTNLIIKRVDLDDQGAAVEEEEETKAAELKAWEFTGTLPTHSTAGGQARYYSVGDKDIGVVQIRERLNQLGYAVSPRSDLYDRDLFGAVKSFQAAHLDPPKDGGTGAPLIIDGRVGPATLRALSNPVRQTIQEGLSPVAEDENLYGITGYPASQLINLSTHIGQPEFLTEGMDLKLSPECVELMLGSLEVDTFEGGRVVVSPTWTSRQILDAVGEQLCFFGPKALRAGRSYTLGRLLLRLSPTLLEELPYPVDFTYSDSLYLTTWASRTEIINHLATLFYLAVYDTPRGDIIVEPLMYDFSAPDFTKYESTLTLSEDQLLSDEFSDTDEGLVTFAQVTGTLDRFAQMETAEKYWISTQWVADEELMGIFGIRTVQLDHHGLILGGLKTEEQGKQLLRAYGRCIMQLTNSNLESMQVTLNFRPTAFVNRPYLHVPTRCYYLAQNIAHRLEFGQGVSASTSIGLSYRRQATQIGAVTQYEKLIDKTTTKGVDMPDWLEAYQNSKLKDASRQQPALKGGGAVASGPSVKKKGNAQ